MLLLTSMTIHNVPEGLCIGVAFGSIALGLDNLDFIQAISLTLAIGLQNFPEGMACALPLQNEGFSKKKSFIFGSMSAIVEPISAVIGAIIVIIVKKQFLPYLLSFASIIMIFGGNK
ncbi:MAG: ZIP family metal transporter [Clostridium sp.]|nr:MAG: ZIP family metal transporter [Clostridium sp.]